MQRKAISIGSVELAEPILTASGTAGYGAEFDSYFPLKKNWCCCHKIGSALCVAWQPGASIAPDTFGNAQCSWAAR